MCGETCSNSPLCWAGHYSVGRWDGTSMGKVAPTHLHNLSEHNAWSLSSVASRSGQGLILPGVKVSCSELGFWKVPGSTFPPQPKASL